MSEERAEYRVVRVRRQWWRGAGLATAILLVAAGVWVGYRPALPPIGAALTTGGAVLLLAVWLEWCLSSCRQEKRG